MEDEKVRGFLISSAQYNALVELLEDIVDLRDATVAEAEYAVGRGRPFSEYDVERKVYPRGDCIYNPSHPKLSF